MQFIACLVLLVGIVNARKLRRDVTCRDGWLIGIRAHWYKTIASARSHRTKKGRFSLVPYRKDASHWFPTASYIKVCHRDDPKVGECVVKNVEAMMPKFSEGIPEMSIPSLNPLMIPAASLNSGGNFKADFTNLKVYGADKFKVKSIDLNLKDKLHLALDLHFDTMRIVTDYKIDGNILVLKLNGHGVMDANLTDISAHASTDAKQYEKNGKTHLGFINSDVNGLVIKKAHFQLDNIFGDNEQLNVQTNQVLNDSAEELIKELAPVITSVTRDIVFGIAEKTLQRYTFDELFPQ